MKLKFAYEILNDQEKRIMYDVYGQIDFSQEDRMKQMIDMTFKTKKEREEQLKAFKSAQSNFKVFGQVGPYYLTWLLLTFYRIEVSIFYNL